MLKMYFFDLEWMGSVTVITTSLEKARELAREKTDMKDDFYDNFIPDEIEIVDGAVAVCISDQ